MLDSQCANARCYNDYKQKKRNIISSDLKRDGQGFWPCFQFVGVDCINLIVPLSHIFAIHAQIGV